MATCYTGKYTLNTSIITIIQ